MEGNKTTDRGRHRGEHRRNLKDKTKTQDMIQRHKFININNVMTLFV